MTLYLYSYTVFITIYHEVPVSGPVIGASYQAGTALRQGSVYEQGSPVSITRCVGERWRCTDGRRRLPTVWSDIKLYIREWSAALGIVPG